MNGDQLPQTALQVRQQLQAQASAFLAQFERLANIRHRGVRGTEREGPVREFLQAHLPVRYSVGTGSIASATDNPGGQHDIVIADRQHSLLLLAATSASLFAIESVLAVVEVRSGPDLKLKKLGCSLQRLRSLRPERGLARYAPLQTQFDLGTTAPAVHTLFAYRGPSKKGIVNTFRAFNEKYTEGHGRCVLDFMLVLSTGKSGDLRTGYVVGYSRKLPQITFPHHYYPTLSEEGLEGPRLWYEGEDCFAFWYASLLHALAGSIAFPPSLYHYMGIPLSYFQVRQEGS
jgi:hypothetical protein